MMFIVMIDGLYISFIAKVPSISLSANLAICKKANAIRPRQITTPSLLILIPSISCAFAIKNTANNIMTDNEQYHIYLSNDISPVTLNISRSTSARIIFAINQTIKLIVEEFILLFLFTQTAKQKRPRSIEAKENV
ncbi:MAG TPA: hypothetical protein EYN13_03260 [Methylococcales bacterium]|nr:hypothetical protein [Methylococcales bacterium]